MAFHLERGQGPLPDSETTILQMGLRTDANSNCRLQATNLLLRPARSRLCSLTLSATATTHDVHGIVFENPHFCPCSNSAASPRPFRYELLFAPRVLVLQKPPRGNSS